MSEKYYYSAQNNAFYPKSMQEIYAEANTWPDDATLITTSWYLKLMEGQAKGFQIVADKYGQPALKKAAEASKDEQVSFAESTKEELMRKAGEEIAPLMDAADLNIATEGEKAALITWKNYRVQLNRVDTRLAPDITWPEAPENVA